MHRTLRLFTSLLLAVPFLTAQSNQPRSIQGPVRDDDTVELRGNVHPKARAQFERGPADISRRMDKMVLVLGVRPDAQADLNTLLAQQHDPKSALYHQWLTPEQFGTRFGIGDDDLAAITTWLTNHGFRVDEVGAGRTWINFSGTTATVEQAFHTQMKDYMVNGEPHHANATEPRIPRALAGVVKGVLSLHDFRKTPQHRIESTSPDFTSGTSHFLAPADFATIYNVKPLYNAGIDGTGQTIAIVGRTDINVGDVTFFRSFFGLPAKSPVITHNGVAPGDLGGGEETEALLDVEWSGAVARNATVNFVVSKSTATTDGVDLSAQFIVNNNLAPAMSTSFGQCESSMGTAENSFYNNLWSQAAAQGITSFVSSGDSGAAGCDASNAATGTGRAVSGLCSTPNNVCVGGTQFNDTANPGAFWASSNNATDQSSVLSYIPEVVWNESGSVAGGSGLGSTGGGPSSIYAKPSWQVAPGVPADGKRDTPDVSLSAAGHDGYIVVQGHTTGTTGLAAVGGTSASSPSFAGLMGLVVQKTGARQGNANTVFYPMGANQYGSAGPAVYHDTNSGNNSVPGVTGFSATTAYDQATGLGSVDANSLVTNWGGTPPPPTPDFAISASPTALSITAGSSKTSTISTTVSGGFSAAVALSATGAPAGATVTFSPASIAAPGSGSSTATVNVGSTTTPGTYSITVTGTGGGKTHSTTISVTVTGATQSQQLLGNPGFETGTAAPWSASAGVIDNTASQPAHSGAWKAWLDGYGSTHTDTLFQQVAIPSTITTATLTFWLHIDSAETTTTTQFDKLTIQVRNSAGTTVLATLGTFSNLNKATGYSQKSFNLSQFKGQTIRIYFVGAEDSSLQTSFVIDDAALNVQ
jgi:subtilase family serine protease